jgi:hypothetical protein
MARYRAGVWAVDDRGLESRPGLRIFSFTTVSRPALGPTQSPIQWIRGALTLWVKLPGRETNHSPPSSAEVKNASSYKTVYPKISGLAAWSQNCK